MARLLTILLIAAFLTSASGAQDIIEGDLLPGKPFDGTSDRASMFDLYQIANITMSAIASDASETELLTLQTLENALSANGYPGTRIILLSEAETLDGSCSQDATVEVRVNRHAERRIAAVVIASEYWFSRGKAGLDAFGGNEGYAQDCQPIYRYFNCKWREEEPPSHHFGSQAGRKMSSGGNSVIKSSAAKSSCWSPNQVGDFCGKGIHLERLP